MGRKPLGMGARRFEFRDKAVLFRSRRVMFGAECRSLTSGFGLQHLELVLNELDFRVGVLEVRSCGPELIQQSSALCIELRPPCSGLSGNGSRPLAHAR